MGDILGKSLAKQYPKIFHAYIAIGQGTEWSENAKITKEEFMKLIAEL